MRRGSTPTHTFETNVDLTGADVVYVTYSQGDTLITKNDVTVTENSITVHLSQEDTLKFSPGLVEIQVRYRMLDGSADASEIVAIDAKRILKDGEI